jgi:hypothetical protein
LAGRKGEAEGEEERGRKPGRPGIAIEKGERIEEMFSSRKGGKEDENSNEDEKCNDGVVGCGNF